MDLKFHTVWLLLPIFACFELRNAPCFVLDKKNLAMKAERVSLSNNVDFDKFSIAASDYVMFNAARVTKCLMQGKERFIDFRDI